ncbi:DNA polymerase delta subunit 4 [Centrocercus urophasianus]|uniref:DNA polymerase delta subunit 4 n=1 Tax=Centrocercus urophasianus TaxID=9002 RepID=UPI001C64B4FE|nr:DNA polymerase delta subunit 4 [Centrocercus urophasianus]
MERARRITDSFPRRHRAQTRAGGKDRSGARRRRGGEGRHRVVPPAPAPPTPPHPAQDEARDPSAPPREAPRELLEMLRRFDLAWEYGPCTGITRLQRWERARALGLNPPATIRDALLEHRDDPAVTYSLWHEYGL